MTHSYDVEEIQIRSIMDPAAMTEAMAKGSNFVYAKEFILNTHGEDVWNRVIDHLPEGASKTLERATLNSGHLSIHRVQKNDLYHLSRTWNYQQ